MSLQVLSWGLLEFNASVYMLRETINNSRFQDHIPVAVWLGGICFEIRHVPPISHVIVEAWSGEGKLLQQYRISHNTVKGLSALTGTKVAYEGEPELSSKPEIEWRTEENGKVIFHSYPLINGDLSNVAFTRMVLAVLPWLE